MTAQVGDWQCDEARHDHSTEAGYYLCCEVLVVSDSGYLAGCIEAAEQAVGQLLNMGPTEGNL